MAALKAYIKRVREHAPHFLRKPELLPKLKTAYEEVYRKVFKEFVASAARRRRELKGVAA